MLLFTLLTLAACAGKTGSPSIKASETETDPVLRNWLAHYDSSGKIVCPQRFKKVEEAHSQFMPGTVKGVFDSGFNSVYEPFFRYSKDNEQYIDFDSYNLSIDSEGNPQMEADQEVNVVNLRLKTVTRIAFRGPSQWVEDAYWKNDSVVCLLENSEDGKLRLTQIHLLSGLTRTMEYTGSVNDQHAYSERRLEEKLRESGARKKEATR